MDAKVAYLSQFFRTITLVNNNGILDVVHDEVFIDNVFGFPRICPNPGFDSCTVGCVCKRAICDGNTIHTLLLWPLTKASNTDAMTWAAGNVSDSDVGAAVSNRNAVIASSNDAVGDANPIAQANVHSIGVWTVPRSSYIEVRE